MSMANKIKERHEKLLQIARRCTGREFEDSDGRTKHIMFHDPGNYGQRPKDNEGAGRGIRGLGMCGHPTTKWPLTAVIEETDEYIVAACDAGCATILLKDPPRKIKRQTKKKTELVVDISGNLVPKRKKTHEDNIFE